MLQFLCFQGLTFLVFELAHIKLAQTFLYYTQITKFLKIFLAVLLAGL